MLSGMTLSEPVVLLRIACGLFFLPHVLGKVLPPHPALGFFKAANFPSPAVVMWIDAVVEILISVCLILGIQTRIVALLGAALLFIAAIATFKVSQGRWLWNFGGAEYPVFWALICLYLAAVTGPN